MDRKGSSILSKLRGYDYTGIDKLISDYLHPVSLLISPKPKYPKKPSTRNYKQPEPDPSWIRSLAVTFSPFLSESLCFLPDRLWESPEHPNTQLFIAQLVDAYKLCLDCLDAVSSQLSGKSYAVHLQRARFIRCLFRWRRYDQAMDEGFTVLKALGSITLDGGGSQCHVTMGKLVPRLPDAKDSGNAVDVEFVHLIVDIVVAIETAVSISKTKNGHKYTSC